MERAESEASEAAEIVLRQVNSWAEARAKIVLGETAVGYGASPWVTACVLPHSAPGGYHHLLIYLPLVGRRGEIVTTRWPVTLDGVQAHLEHEGLAPAGMRWVCGAGPSYEVNPGRLPGFRCGGTR